MYLKNAYEHLLFRGLHYFDWNISLSIVERENTPIPQQLTSKEFALDVFRLFPSKMIKNIKKTYLYARYYRFNLFFLWKYNNMSLDL